MIWKYKTHLCRLRFREEDLSIMFPCRQAAVDNEFPACAKCHAELSMWTLTKQTNSYSSSFSFSDLKLSIKHRREILFPCFSPTAVVQYLQEESSPPSIGDWHSHFPTVQVSCATKICAWNWTVWNLVCHTWPDWPMPVYSWHVLQ